MNAAASVGIGDAKVSLKKGETLALKIDNASTGIKAIDVVIVLPDGMQSLGIDSYVEGGPIGGTHRALYVKVNKAGDIEANWSITQPSGDCGEPKRNFISVAVS